MEIDNRIAMRAEIKMGLPIETLAQFFSETTMMKQMARFLLS